MSKFVSSMAVAAFLVASPIMVQAHTALTDVSEVQDLNQSIKKAASAVPLGDIKGEKPFSGPHSKEGDALRGTKESVMNAADSYGRALFDGAPANPAFAEENIYPVVQAYLNWQYAQEVYRRILQETPGIEEARKRLGDMEVRKLEAEYRRLEADIDGKVNEYNQYREDVLHRWHVVQKKEA